MSTIKNTIWLWPGPYTTETSRGYEGGHKGIDIVAEGIYGTPVIAAADGAVDRVFKGCKNENSGWPPANSCTGKGCANGTNWDVDYEIYEYDENGNIVYDENNNPISREQMDAGVEGVIYDQNVHLITNPYNANGGELGSAVKNYMINIGGSAKIRSDVPKEPEGYEFDGWLCKVDGVVKGTYREGESITGLGTSTDVTLTAVWEEKVFKA